MTVWPLPRVTFRELSTIDERRPVALLTNDDVWAVLGSQIILPILIQAEPSRYSRELFEYLADHLPTQVQAVYAVGYGAPIHAGKVIAARNHKPLVIIPTVLDSDMLFTPTAFVEELDENGNWLTVEETGPADEIIIDWSLIQTGPDHLRGAGIVDVLSVVTGLLDWRYAAQKGKNPPEQRFAPWAATITAGLASQAIKSATAIGQGSPDALHILLDLMMLGVQLSNQFGHARARAGSEHYLAQIVFGQTGLSGSYSEIVAPMILFVSALHGQDPTALREALEHAGVRLDQVKGTDVQVALSNLAAALEGYGFPYSMLNDLDPASELVTQALQTADLSVKEDTWQVPAIITEEVTEEQPAPAEEALPAGEVSPVAEVPAADDAQPSDTVQPADTQPADAQPPAEAAIEEQPADNPPVEASNG